MMSLVTNRDFILSLLVVRPGEYPPLSYLEIIGDFIEIGSIIGLVLTVALDAFGWIMALLFISMLIPSQPPFSIYA